MLQIVVCFRHSHSLSTQLFRTHSVYTMPPVHSTLLVYNGNDDDHPMVVGDDGPTPVTPAPANRRSASEIAAVESKKKKQTKIAKGRCVVRVKRSKLFHILPFNLQQQVRTELANYVFLYGTVKSGNSKKG